MCPDAGGWHCLAGLLRHESEAGWPRGDTSPLNVSACSAPLGLAGPPRAAVVVAAAQASLSRPVHSSKGRIQHMCGSQPGSHQI